MTQTGHISSVLPEGILENFPELGKEELSCIPLLVQFIFIIYNVTGTVVTVGTQKPAM